MGLSLLKEVSTVHSRWESNLSCLRSRSKVKRNSVSHLEVQDRACLNKDTILKYKPFSITFKQGLNS